MTRSGSGRLRVLFVCWHNSARSIMAEALLRQHAPESFEVHSAGIEPGRVNLLTVHVLEEAGLPTVGLTSKSVNDYAGQRFDYVITVCDESKEACPVFPGSDQSLHWGYPDPSAANGTEEERLAVFRSVLTQLGLRVREFVPFALRARGGGAATRA